MEPHFGSIEGSTAPTGNDNGNGEKSECACTGSYYHEPSKKPVQLNTYTHRELPHSSSARQYYCYIRVNKYAVRSSFNCLIFIGPCGGDGTTESENSNLVGTLSVYTNGPTALECDPYQNPSATELIVTGCIPLNTALCRYVTQLISLAPENVIPFLQDNLHWRCHMPDNTPISLDQIPSLKVGVAMAVVQIPAADSIVENLTEWEPLYQITAGRQAGLAKGDSW